jgi:hypothetical protein
MKTKYTILSYVLVIKISYILFLYFNVSTLSKVAYSHKVLDLDD